MDPGCATTSYVFFRFQARYALLTYAQCGDLDPFAVVNHLAELGAECIIGRENHSDGGLHLHAFVDFGRKYRTRNTRAFDVEGCHPNVSPSRGTPEEGYDYAIKDGDVVAGGLERPAGSGLASNGDVWPEIINAKDESEFWSLCESLAPRALVTQFTQPELSPPGSSHQSESRMKLRRELSSTRLGWLNSIAGYETTLSQVKQEVSYLARRPDLAAPTRGAFGGTSPRGTPPPSARGLECAGNATEG